MAVVMVMVDDGHDHDGDDVRHGCGHGYFVFHIFIHNKPPRGLRRPTNNNKKTYSTFILFLNPPHLWVLNPISQICFNLL